MALLTFPDEKPAARASPSTPRQVRRLLELDLLAAGVNCAPGPMRHPRDPRAPRRGRRHAGGATQRRHTGASRRPDPLAAGDAGTWRCLPAAPRRSAPASSAAAAAPARTTSGRWPRRSGGWRRYARASAAPWSSVPAPQVAAGAAPVELRRRPGRGALRPRRPARPAQGHQRRPHRRRGREARRRRPGRRPRRQLQPAGPAAHGLAVAGRRDPAGHRSGDHPPHHPARLPA